MSEGNQYRQGLAQFPLLAVIIVVVLFWISTLWGSFLDGVSVLVLKFISLGVVSLLVIPFGLKLPFGGGTFRQYADGIYLRFSEWPGRQAALGVLTGLLLVLSLPAANFFIGQTAVNWGRIDAYQVLDALVHGVWEEVLFRGVVLVLCLRRFRSPIAGAALAAAVFAALHLNLYHFFRLFCMAMLWVVMTMETRSLLAAALSHVLYDALFAAFTPSIAGTQAFRWLILWQVLVALVCVVGVYVSRRWFRQGDDFPDEG